MPRHVAAGSRGRGPGCAPCDALRTEAKTPVHVTNTETNVTCAKPTCHPPWERAAAKSLLTGGTDRESGSPPPLTSEQLGGSMVPVRCMGSHSLPRSLLKTLSFRSKTTKTHHVNTAPRTRACFCGGSCGTSSGWSYTECSFPSTLRMTEAQTRGPVPWGEQTTAPPVSRAAPPPHSRHEDRPLLSCSNNTLTGRTHVCHTQRQPHTWSGRSHPGSVP